MTKEEAVKAVDNTLGDYRNKQLVLKVKDQGADVSIEEKIITMAAITVIPTCRFLCRIRFCSFSLNSLFFFRAAIKKILLILYDIWNN